MGSMNAALEIEIKAAGDDLAEATEAASKLGASLRDVSAETENAAESVETHTEAVEELADAMDDATDATEASTKANKAAASAADAATKATEQQARATEAAAKADEKAAKAKKQRERAERNWRTTVRLATRETSQAFDRSAKLQQSAQPLIGFSRQAFGGLKSFVDAAASLDATLGDAAAVTGLAQKDLAEAVRAAARGTTSARAQVAEAALAFGSLGVRAVDETALRAATDLATISRMNASGAAQAIAAAANATGETDLGRVSKLIGASSSPQDVARVMATTGARAKLAGFGASDLAALSQTLHVSGFAGDKANEAIAGIMNALSDSSKRGALARLGVTEDTRGDLGSMISAIQARGQDMHSRTYQHLLREAFGETAPAAIDALVGKVDELRETARRFGDDKALGEAFQKKFETTDGQARAMEEFSAALSDLKGSISEGALKTIAGGVRGLSAAVRGVTWLFDELPWLGTAATGLAATGAALAGVLGSAMAVGGAFISLGAVLKGAAILGSGGLKALGVLAAAGSKTAGVILKISTNLGKVATKIAGFGKVAFAKIGAGLKMAGGALLGVGKAIAPLIKPALLVASTVALVAQNFELLKGAAKGGMAMLGLGAVKIAELVEPLLSLVGVDIAGDIAGAKDRLAGLFASAADDIGTWQEATFDSWFNAINPLNVLQTRENISEARARRAREAAAATGQGSGQRDAVGIEVRVADDRVVAAVRHGHKAIELSASQGLAAVGAT